MQRLLLPALVLTLCHPVRAQHLMSDQDARDQMKYDIQYLASDLLEGREAGTKGEKLAADYIAQKFSSIGLMPYGDSATYLQKFPFAAPPEVGPGCSLQIGRRKLKMGDDYYPIALSEAVGQLRSKLVKCGYGIVAPELNYNDYDGVDLKGQCAAISIGSPDGIHPHSKYLAYHELRPRIEKAVELGAVAIILYNNDATAEPPSEKMNEKTASVGVPVLYVKGDLYKQVIETGNPVAMRVDIVRAQRTAMNVVGLLDNGKPNIVVIGAHFDHLGYGDEGSLYRGEPAIHNGADDNASGIAAILQLARDLQEMDEARANDYLFIAFSGEEKGLYGSNWWTKHPTLPLSEISYMINLDMVGRIDSTNDLAINGVGTSPTWEEVKRIKVGGFNVKTTEGGIGPSDHTSFYLKDIPAIHFFSGSHADYHKPSDDEDKINYDGMLRVTRFIESLITTLNDDPKLTFTKTQDADSAATPHFTVTLGVVPDYMYDGKGMRIDGVTDGKPASHAGLKPGDVVIKLGDHNVADMMSYMEALGAFKKGDATRVTVIRDGQEMQADIQF